MVDVVLLTEGGIVFCTATKQTLDDLRATLQQTPEVTRLLIPITNEQGVDQKIVVAPVNILLGSSRH